jgi:predicted ribosomally synthesized peptide with nif11-like leader
MSVEDLKKYGLLCGEQEEVRNKAKAIGLENVDGLIAHASELGLHFTQADIMALAQEGGVNMSDELSEEDLEKVAGGFATATAIACGGVAVAVLGVISAVGAAGAAVAACKSW